MLHLIVTLITVVYSFFGYCPVSGFSQDPREVWDTLLESSDVSPWVLRVGTDSISLYYFSFEALFRIDTISS